MSAPTVERLIDACRAPDDLAPRDAGLWYTRRFDVRDFGPVGYWRLPRTITPYQTWTALFRWTDATIHLGYGECVMEDSPEELRRHLPILVRARGRVLVTGLGMGCVVRGLLARPDVEHIDVVEIDPHILTLAGLEFEAEPRVTLHEGDALTYDWPAGARWDYAWHDCWCEDGPLDGLHARLLARYRGRCDRQGAWQLDRRVKDLWPDPLLNSRNRYARRGLRVA